MYSGEEILAMQFPTISFKGDWKDHLGLPEKGFLMLIYGKPGSGKSTYAIKFADYLSRNHGKTLYVSAEELIGYTLQDKIKRNGALKAKFVGELPNNLSGWDFIFLDSAQKLGLKLSDIEKLNKKYPATAFIFIYQSTKSGEARGSQQDKHEVDIAINVIEGTATIDKNRFGSNEAMPIF